MTVVEARAKFFFEGGRKVFLKGATYGPFAPDERGEHFGAPAGFRRDAALLREAGFNTLRVYYVPPAWFADACAEAGLRLLVTLPWANHVAFLKERRARREIVRQARASVAGLRGHPAVLGWLVGNEIPSGLVRWMGPRRVGEFLEGLIEACRQEDATKLYSYATYPPTEYLVPANADFVTFNVYLHRRVDFERYLARLHNLAGEKPLVFGEFGMDTLRHTEEEQAELVRWHIESCVRGGAAGTFLYAFTDEWFRGGQEITDWAFGLVTRKRRPKKAYFAAQSFFAGDEPLTRKAGLPRAPKVSVIVCSYNGAGTLEDCLTSLRALNYPDYEVILVDDGSTDHTPEIAARHPWVVSIRQDNLGLSAARNTGAGAAKGEVIAYTDSDCMADPDWLYYLVGTLVSGDFAGVGGPNISPPAQNWIQACVAAAPGGPSHVLLTDVVAEHIPGCNMAFYKGVFEQVGGFDPLYRKAGDDVDFCWRVQQAGGVIAFSPAAVVWHYRRFTLRAFRKQQEGYGEAESLLRFQHLVFFGPTGTVKWKGQIYGAPRFSWLLGRPVIYHGVFGEGLFQSMYARPQSDIAAYLSSIEWAGLTALVVGLSFVWPELRLVGILMFGGAFLVAVSYMVHARLEAKFDTVAARLLVMLLALVQPWVRGWWRYWTWLRMKRVKGVLSGGASAGGGGREALFWSEDGAGREQLLRAVIAELEEGGWSYSTDTGWQAWDIQVYGSYWWSVRLATATEYHGGPKCLTRVRLEMNASFTVLLAAAAAAAVLIFRQAAVVEGVDIWGWGGVALGAALLWLRGVRLRGLVAGVVAKAASRCGMMAVSGKRRVEPRRKPNGKPEVV